MVRNLATISTAACYAALISVSMADIPVKVQKKVLQQYPKLDLNSDGVITMEEIEKGKARAPRQVQVRLDKLLGKLKGGSNGGQGRSRSELDPASFLEGLGLKAELDVEYKTGTAQRANRLDFIYPKQKVYSKAPLFIYIHGGGNVKGSKISVYDRGDLVVKELTEAGIAVASIDYRLFNQGEDVALPQLYEDCKDALRFLAKNAERFGIDPHKFITWGTSAGGSKALIAAFTDSAAFPGEVEGPGTEHTVIGAVSFFGATTYVDEDVWKSRSNQAKADMIFKAHDGMSSDEIRKLTSADQYVKSGSPPFLLVHGDKDTVVPVENSRHLHKLAMEKGVDVTYVEVKNAGHVFKPVKGSDGPPSMTWEETQKLVIEQVLDWVKP